MTTTITSRVGSAPTADNTKRVATSGAVAASAGGYGNFAWIGWGLAWRNCWRSVNVGTGATPASPATDITPRIGAAATANNTKRVTF
jgi:hypothetical protein